jgi:porin
MTGTPHRPAAALFLAPLLALAPLSAKAQETNGTSPTPPAPAGAPSTPAASPSDQGYLFSLITPQGQAAGQSLADHGIYLDGLVDGVLSAVPAGGLRQGTVQDGEVFFGFDLDMKRIAGLDEAAVHVSFDDRYGPNAALYTGSGFNIPYTYGPVQNFFLSELSWDQSLFGDHLRLLVGRINPDIDFDTSPLYGQFITSAVNSNSVGYYFDDGAVQVPFSAWGARLTLKPTPDTYLRTGAYQSGDPGYLYDETGTYHGFAFGAGRSSGALVPIEAGYQTDTSSDAHPRPYDLGGYVDTSAYTVPGSTLTRSGRAALYLQAQQMVYRVHPDDPNDARGLTLFTQGFWSVEGEVPDAAFYEAGLWDKGPFAARPQDSLGLVFVVSVLGSAYRAAIDQALAGNGRLAATEQTVELNYGFELAPGMEVKPYLQYIQNPEYDGVPLPAHDPHALVIGFAYTVNIPNLLGLPALTRND